jgi:hypothetical protein
VRKHIGTINNQFKIKIMETRNDLDYANSQPNENEVEDFIKPFSKQENEMIEKYTNWILQECDTPHNEIEWLVKMLPQDIREDILETIKNH